MSTFTIGEQDFLLDGEPYRILSGALHYFRVHPGQWADRISMARHMGLNTIETYVAWNEHSPRRGEFETRGRLDLVRFLELVQEAGMHAIVRPGPFICAEWDNGGLPGWVTRECGADIRTSAPSYLGAVKGYLDHLLPLLAPLQIDQGGPIILMQIENEYGAYGSDKAYLGALVEETRGHGITVPLTTVDQPSDEMLEAGGLPELHKTGSFGSAAGERLAVLRRHQPSGPLMCAEFWDGWFDHWGGHHHTTDAAESARELDAILSLGASVNIYMFHGGTNYGLTNGANHKGHYEPTTTSYDYDAPLSEHGSPTEKYFAFREVIGKYVELPEMPMSSPTSAPSFEVQFDRSIDILSTLADAQSVRFEQVVSMDEIDHFRGFALYRTTLSSGGVLEFKEIRDRAHVFVNGLPLGVLDRQHNDRRILLPDDDKILLELFVEDEGRVNYGPRIGERKGIIGPVTLDGRPVSDWEVVALDLENLDSVVEATLTPATSAIGPVVAVAHFTLPAQTDLHLANEGLAKGVAWLNGWPLGRYWARGPQRSLYVPGASTRAGENELVFLELSGVIDGGVRFLARPDLGSTEQ